ncbi:glycoprotein-N-acetylgalactosamine 3-beta-galactosyltransferase 1-like isoform X3 [Bactrocera tryoni]|uniref:glycoprotein-N-acetylgalactosamine 3-beta-galactosyltransferase 1-like isoform X3 n=1 Tax=Bactrocera tryoni TaxID=59916 RepID=UPI001A95C2CC|nr:glycoprotein-N-acetylgalactosamine 3-beta-galactosyltransferase 1-like isoform X3 [Bactrocera tryoni]
MSEQRGNIAQIEQKKCLRFYRRLAFVTIEIALIAAFLSYRHNITSLEQVSWLHEEKVFAENATQNNTNLAELLYKEVRILCWIMTTPKNHRTRAIHIKRTWGKHCNRLLFVTSEDDEELGETVVINEVEDKYEVLWPKMRIAFERIYEKYANETDWFFKADDDAYAYIENMRYFLYAYSPDMPIYFGYNLLYGGRKDEVYMSGGSGFVSSREAVRLFVESAIVNKSGCDINNHYNPDDVAIGECFRAVDVIAGDSRDVHGEARFYLFAPFMVLMPELINEPNWYFNYSFYNPRSRLSCKISNGLSLYFSSRHVSF